MYRCIQKQSLGSCFPVPRQVKCSPGKSLPMPAAAIRRGKEHVRCPETGAECPNSFMPEVGSESVSCIA